jgi:hypothetical protein
LRNCRSTTRTRERRAGGGRPGFRTMCCLPSVLRPAARGR